MTNVVLDTTDRAAVEAAFALYWDFGAPYPVDTNGWAIQPIITPDADYIKALRAAEVSRKTVWLYEIGELGGNKKSAV